MKRFFLLAVLVLIPLISSAHEIKKSGTLEVLLHMEPGDDPVAREEAQLYFSVTDSNEKFSYSNCDCTVTASLQDSDTQIFSKRLTADDEAPDWGVNVSRVVITFPKIGLYDVKWSAKLKNSTFADATLDYVVRVERESLSEPAGSSGCGLGTTDCVPQGQSGREWLKNYYYIGGTIIILGIIIYEVIARLKKKNK